MAVVGITHLKVNTQIRVYFRYTTITTPVEKTLDPKH